VRVLSRSSRPNYCAVVVCAYQSKVSPKEQKGPIEDVAESGGAKPGVCGNETTRSGRREDQLAKKKKDAVSGQAVIRPSTVASTFAGKAERAGGRSLESVIMLCVLTAGE
jgi:hypothetical protein